MSYTVFRPTPEGRETVGRFDDDMAARAATPPQGIETHAEGSSLGYVDIEDTSGTTLFRLTWSQDEE